MGVLLVQIHAPPKCGTIKKSPGFFKPGLIDLLVLLVLLDSS